MQPLCCLLFITFITLFSFQGASGLFRNQIRKPNLLDSLIHFRYPVLFKSGGDNRDRTDDPLLAKQVLSQLSYTPIFAPCFPLRKLYGGPKWTRTTDLTIISRAL